MACGKILSNVPILSILGFVLSLLELFGSVGCISVTEHPESLTIVEGDPAFLKCDISGIESWQGVLWLGTYKYNSTSIPWYINAHRNGAILNGDVSSVADRHGDHYNFYEQLDNGITRFYYSVYNTTLYDQGDYGCGYYDTRISRGDRSLYVSEIIVISNYAKLTVLTRPTCLMQPLPLPFEKPDADTRITLTCGINVEEDNPMLTWYRNGELISSSSYRSNSYTYDITIADNGVNFSCVASAPRSLTNPMARSCSLTPLKKAFIEPKRQTISVGNNASFTCSADGLQITDISWVTDGTVNPSIKVTESKATYSKLQVTDVQLEHSETEIICQVTLVTGDIINASASLNVQEPSGQLPLYIVLSIVSAFLLLFLLLLVLICRRKKSKRSEGRAPPTPSPAPSAPDRMQTNAGFDNRAMVLQEDGKDMRPHVSITNNFTINNFNVQNVTNVNSGASGNTHTSPSRHVLPSVGYTQTSSEPRLVGVPAIAFPQMSDNTKALTQTSSEPRRVGVPAIAFPQMAHNNRRTNPRATADKHGDSKCYKPEVDIPRIEEGINVHGKIRELDDY